MINQNLHLSQQKIHQKTALADGFNYSVAGKPTIVPQTEVLILYHKIVKLSKEKVSSSHLRGLDGIRTRTFYLRNRWSAINLRAQVTEAGGLSHRPKRNVKLEKNKQTKKALHELRTLGGKIRSEHE